MIRKVDQWYEKIPARERTKKNWIEIATTLRVQGTMRLLRHRKQALNESTLYIQRPSCV